MNIRQSDEGAEHCELSDTEENEGFVANSFYDELYPTQEVTKKV